MKPSPEEYTNEETIRRRDAAIKRALNTPHKPQRPLGKKAAKKKTKKA